MYVKTFMFMDIKSFFFFLTQNILIPINCGTVEDSWTRNQGCVKFGIQKSYHKISTDHNCGKYCGKYCFRFESVKVGVS